MKNSSDVGVIKLGLRLGDERFANYIERLGFGRLTNIDLPGEERGLTKPAERWSRVSVGAISMGQEIGTTPLQIVTMVSAVANGGTLYRPYVVARVEHPQKGILEQTDPQGERVLSAATASELREMLEIVVTDGTAKSGRLEGYTAAGKTGTAQKIDETGRYSKSKYVASFAGYAPATNPVISFIVVVDEPRGLYHGGEVAAPIFKRIAEQTLRYLSIPPDVPHDVPPSRQDDKTREPARRTPAPTMRVDADRVMVVDAAYTAPSQDGSESNGITIPDFFGKSLRQVTEECLRLGIRLRSVGSGAASEQLPPPGSSVRTGGYVQVKFTTKR
jgi:membrane peptidoglycan carboxypeptidase